jgi:hypothetical protein
MKNVAVEVVFAADGAVQIRQVQVDGQWLAVGQGRQWVDDNGRHCLIMLPDNSVREIVLQPDTLTWIIKPLPGAQQIV